MKATIPLWAGYPASRLYPPESSPGPNEDRADPWSHPEPSCRVAGQYWAVGCWISVAGQPPHLVDMSRRQLVDQPRSHVERLPSILSLPKNIWI
jgi:hypothetical protein